MSAMFFTVLVVAAQIERDYIPGKPPGGQVIAASKGNHAGRPKAIDDDMLTLAQALEEEIPRLCLISTVSPPVSGVLGEALE
ncbi:hypothetical protein [Streptomyces sp. NPDC059455]|uniref:hypothetical protein n=1 Tax=Streptomyces sp. NPDC059455 TaxID=3346837 RepID=UPI00367E335F